MITVGAFEAKQRLSVLLDRVAAGEEVLITRYGKPVARMVTVNTVRREDIDTVIARLKTLRAGARLGLNVGALKDEGRW